MSEVMEKDKKIDAEQEDMHCYGDRQGESQYTQP